MLEVTHLNRTFSADGNKVTAVSDVSFKIPTGCFASIIGKSGSGKTTLLSLLGTLDKPTDGSIVIDKNDVTKMSDRALVAYRRKKIGFVFQSYNLIPNLTALENVMLPMSFDGASRRERKARATELLAQVGLTPDQLRRKPGKLSGGQQQRVAIARALVNHPSLILADEPTGNLDTATGQMIFDLLHELARTQNTTIVVVTHDLAIAGSTDRSFHLQDGKLVK